MNNLEKERLNIAKKLINEYGARGYKTSFEDEGASFEDISRAMIITEAAGLDLNIKIGGCEAIANIREAKILGAKTIISPMIETVYAAKKFISALKAVYSEEELAELYTGLNIETITGVNNIEEILKIPNIEKYINRIVVGRVDLVGSMDKPRSEINSQEIYNCVEKVLSKSKEKGIETAMGGGIDFKAIPFIKKLGNILDHYETRYIIFDNDKNRTEKEMALGMIEAQKFEANYLEDVSNRYRVWSTSNSTRCEMIKSRVVTGEEYINNNF